MTSPTWQGADWVEVLEQIRTALDAALSATVARDRALPEEETQARVPLSLKSVTARVGRLKALAERAVTQQAERATGVSEGEESLRRWLAEAVTARQRLAEWASRSVG
jgi:hypothetical protein